MQVAQDDFLHALEEVKPAFGAMTETLQQYAVHGIINCGDTFEHMRNTLRTLCHQVRAGAACV